MLRIHDYLWVLENAFAMAKFGSSNIFPQIHTVQITTTR